MGSFCILCVASFNATFAMRIREGKMVHHSYSGSPLFLSVEPERKPLHCHHRFGFIDMEENSQQFQFGNSNSARDLKKSGSRWQSCPSFLPVPFRQWSWTSLPWKPQLQVQLSEGCSWPAHVGMLCTRYGITSCSTHVQHCLMPVGKPQHSAPTNPLWQNSGSPERNNNIRANTELS